MAILLSRPVEKTGDPGAWPAPPPNLMEYREASDVHIRSGRKTYEKMGAVCLELGFDIAKARRCLDFGCSNGRVTRWFDTSGDREVWGCDIQAEKILWAQENLGPPLRFMVTETSPHLPFRDGYFDFVVAQSIFTHMQANHVAWLMELCRLLSPRGALFMTTVDATAVRTQRAIEQWLPRRFAGYEKFAPDLDQVGFLSMRPYKNGLAQVYMSSEYLRRILPPWLSVDGPVACAYSEMQSGYLIRPSR